MPGLDGFETCRELRAIPGFESLPVLMLTGLDDDASITRAYEAGATDFFVKSTQWSLLAGRLRYLLRARARARSSSAASPSWRARRISRAWAASTGAARPSSPRFSVEGLRVFGHAPGSRLGFRKLMHMIPAGERKPFMRRAARGAEHKSVLATDVQARLADGRERIIHVEAEPEFNEHGTCSRYTGIVQDVTDRRVAEDQIRHLANFDALTGLPNRRQLIWRAESALEAGRRLGHQAALLLIDLDRFKNVNDTLGHAAGDELLMEVARRLRSCVRHTDQFMEGALEAVGSRSHRLLEAVGRLGGDEFVALLPEVADERDAERVATRILEQMRQPIFVAGEECFVTASVGIALFPRDGVSVADLMRNSDVAMYSVKATGPQRGLAVPPAARRPRPPEARAGKRAAQGDRAQRAGAALPAEDRRARGAHGRRRGADALAARRPAGAAGRLHPAGRGVGADHSAVGMGDPRGGAPGADWQLNFGFADSIAVNLPNQLFERTDLVEHIHDAVTTYGVPHHSIELEITETGLMKDLQNVIPSLHRLNEIGVEISIDDFGTGYSSLAYLTTLPISEVKIDRSFVRDLGMTPQSAAVISAIIALARTLNLRVVAEGVENIRQMDVLHRLGCSIMQGFLFSKPLPPADLERWLKQTVLPRKAPWIVRAGEADFRGGDSEPPQVQAAPRA